MFGNQVAGSISHDGTHFFSSFNPKENLENPEQFLRASKEEIEGALIQAEQACYSFAISTKFERSVLLLLIAEELEKSKTEIEHSYCKESGLSVERFEIEYNRTLNQLRLFADYLENSFLELISETPQNKENNLPKLEKKRIPIGPVVVFGASNFPLAYSTIGGDSVSALAAGCPIIVKAHPFHPETSYCVGRAIQNAISKTKFHPGIFSQLFDDGYEVAQTLVQDSRIKAVGFTGSYAGGKALLNLINQREISIPLFAEMGSSNPVFIFPQLLGEKSEEWSTLFAKSITNDAGQFCTKPGIFFVPNNENGKFFVDSLTKKVIDEHSFTMLHSKIYQAFERKKQERKEKSGGTLIEKEGELEPLQGRQAILITTVDVFVQFKTIQQEVFGPFALIVFYNSNEDLQAAINLLDGQLTASLLLSDLEFDHHQALIFKITEKAGRIIRNGVPTGVRVCESMHHGGPFPATTDSRFTAVGTDSILRFTRPIVFQN